MSKKFADEPTQRFPVADIVKFARETEAARESLVAHDPATDVEVEVDVEDDDPWLDRVPIVLASAEDLTWFGLELGPKAVLGLIGRLSSASRPRLSCASSKPTRSSPSSERGAALIWCRRRAPPSRRRAAAPPHWLGRALP